MASSVDFAGSDTEVLNTGSGGFSDISMAIFGKFVEVAEAVVILAVVYFVMKWVRRYFSKIETAHEQQKTALNFLERIINGFLLVIGVTIALKTVGLDVSLLVSVGVLGLSYGLKDVIKNYVAGIIIFFKAPFKIGDIVKIKKFVGKIERMDFQSTGLKTFDNRDITIYNSDIISESIENYSRLPVRRMEIDVRFGYGTDLEKAKIALENILKSEPAIQLKPKYSIVFRKFAQDAVVLQMRFWVSSPSNMLAVKSSVAFKIHQIFDEETVFSPYVKSIENDKSFAQGAETKSKLKEFLVGPVTVGTEQPALVLAEAMPDIADSDEPSMIEEDIGK
ncbi:MAG: mechanosensitive ion channel family protein [Candidatus Gracilibacteria bacterium]|jgi:small-conductance mechanosensitive channel